MVPLRLFTVLPQDMRVKCGIDSLVENNSNNKYTVIVYCAMCIEKQIFTISDHGKYHWN